MRPTCPLQDHLWKPKRTRQGLNKARLDQTSLQSSSDSAGLRRRRPAGEVVGKRPSHPGDEAVSVISKPVRERDRDHLRFVAAQPCLVCGRTPSDAHHLKFAEQRTMGRKVSGVKITKRSQFVVRRGDEFVPANRG
jgi:hypothetical protein